MYVYMYINNKEPEWRVQTDPSYVLMASSYLSVKYLWICISYKQNRAAKSCFFQILEVNTFLLITTAKSVSRRSNMGFSLRKGL